MYVIVEINGQQFKAEEGKKLFVHHIQNAENGATVEFEKVSVGRQQWNSNCRCSYCRRCQGSLRSSISASKRR